MICNAINELILNKNSIKMCLHSFHQTSRTEIYICSICGCICYNEFEFFNFHKDNKEITALSIPLITEVSFEEYNTIHPDYNNAQHIKFISSRKNEIKYLCKLGQVSKCNLSIVFRAILYLDKLFLSSHCNLPIREASLICFALSLKYNGYSIQSPIFHFCNILNKEISNFKEKEIACLQLLDYDLNQLSSYEIIEQIFNSGIPFTSIPDIKLVYEQCISLFYEIIIDTRSLDFSPNVSAYSIIIMICKRFNSFSLKLFTLAYKANYQHIEMTKCFLVLNAVIQSKSKYSCKRREKKTKTNCSSSTIDTIENN